MSRAKAKPARANRPAARRAPKAPAAAGAILPPPYRTTKVPLPHPALDALPQPVTDHYEGLRAVALRTPRKAIEALELLVEGYPQVPQFYNLLVVAHAAAGDHAGAEACIRRAYEAHPDYLFARLNYAELCLSKGEAEKVPEVLGGRFDLRALYPGRKVFHVGEVVPFCGLVAQYFHQQGDDASAEAHLEVMQALAPKDPMTRKVARLLHPPLLKRLLRRLR